MTVQTEGGRQVRRAIDHYNLDAILAVGYRVRSIRGTQFRQWATAQLRELLVKGFVMDDERLKAGESQIGDYFEELLARIRDIRASERRFYQKITDIYATSIDYDKNSEISKSFYATVQNKLHWAIHGQTAAEVVHKRADAAKPNMGLTTWKNAPKGKIRKGDVCIAKNYLSEEEMAALNRVVTMYLDYAEDQAQRRQTMHMADWVRKLDGFLQFNERNILTPFADLVMPIFHRVVALEDRLGGSGGEPPSLEEVMRLTRGWIEEAGRRAVANPELGRSFDRARFGLVAWIDEALTDSEWGRSAGWGSEQHVLEWFTFGSRGRAYLFYEHADAAEAHGDVDALEVYLLCVTLGFRGEHVSNAEKSTEWVERVYGRISEASSVPSKPFPDDEAVGLGLAPMGGPSLLLVVSSLFAVSALFTLAAYLFAVHYSYNPTG